MNSTDNINLDKVVKPMHPIKKILIIVSLAFLVVASILALWVSRNHTTPIMMYHKVDYTDETRADTVSPELFETHMEYLYQNGFRVITLGELVYSIKRGRKIPKNMVVITFDDGYANNHEYALEILKKYDFPATIFMPAEFVDKEEDFMTTEQLKDFIAIGSDIGSHTLNHAYLPEISREEQRREIVESKRILQEKLGIDINFFCYPVGGFSDYIKKIVKEAGYKGAVATNRGYDRFNKDVFELNRIRFSDKDNTDTILWSKLSGYYNLFRSLKKPY